MQSTKVRDRAPSTSRLSEGFGRPGKLVVCRGYKKVQRTSIIGKQVPIDEPVGIAKYEGRISESGGQVEVEYVGAFGKVQVERFPMNLVVHLEYRQ